MDTGSPTQVSRRSFFVAAGGAVLGRFALPMSRALGESPAVPSSLPACGGSVPAAEPQEVLVRLACRPGWFRNARGRFMIWTEFSDARGEDGKRKPRMMEWFPETAQEWAEANRFYEAATWRSYTSFADLESRPRLPGPFVIRWGLAGGFWYLRSADEFYLRRAEERQMSGGNAELELWTGEPGEAITLGHGQAIRVTIRLQGILGEPGPNTMIYLEPVSLADAIAVHARFSTDS